MEMQHKIGDLVICKLNKDDITPDDPKGLTYAFGHISYYDTYRNKYEVMWHDNDKKSVGLSPWMIEEMKRLISRMCDGIEKINESGMPKTW